LLRRFIAWQIKLCRALDRLLPAEYSVDGNSDFLSTIVPTYLSAGARVYDVGGGKHPCLSLDVKRSLGLTILGFDIDAEELGRAPQGIYDVTICGDVTKYLGNEDADVVICQSLLEHVPDLDAAIASIRTMLKPGGFALVFVPSRNALFARLNLLLPEKLKRWILFSIFPQKRRSGGFPSYYDKCTLTDLRAIAARHEFRVETERCYYASSYFSFFFPLYVLWRGWVLFFRAVAGPRAAETYSFALQRRG
jgi:SAM-dependent methyltransferase